MRILGKVAIRIALFSLHVFLFDESALKLPLLLVASITSATSCACLIVFFVFMIRTIAACVSYCRSAATRSCVFFVLLFRLFQLNGVELDAVLLVVKIGIDGESVCVVNITAFGMLRKWPQLGASQRLQRTLDLRFRCMVLA
ncbi:hypothetical protein MRB53_040883 [Persea americana]|nr:hypothetical protein MRB53_040883 [Persea americana]